MNKEDIKQMAMFVVCTFLGTTMAIMFSASMIVDMAYDEIKSQAAKHCGGQNECYVESIKNFKGKVFGK